MSWFSRGALERSVERLWYGDSAFAWCLRPFALIFRVLVAIRAGAYRLDLLPRERMAVPVIVVGNITAGGTGKTPLVAWIAAQLSRAGRKPGIVSRGYRASPGGYPVMVRGTTGVLEVGDEALVLARQTGAPICVGANRIAACRRLVDEAGADILIADDGLQHYRLARDLEIAVVDGCRVLGNGYMLPAGPLREPKARLKQVDIVLINGESDFSEGYSFHLIPGDAISLIGAECRDLATFSGKRVWSVAGIGNPERFSKMLKSFGIDPVPVDVPDHGSVSLAALKTENPWPILMTEKDAVKYMETPIENAWFVPVEVRMSEQSEAEVMNLIRALISDG